MSCTAQEFRPEEEWLAWYQKFWNRRLDELQKLLEGEEDE